MNDMYMSFLHFDVSKLKLSCSYCLQRSPQGRSLSTATGKI